MEEDFKGDRKRANEIVEELEFWIKSGSYSKITKQMIMECFKGCNHNTANMVYQIIKERNDKVIPKRKISESVMIICRECGSPAMVRSGSEQSVRAVCEKCFGNERIIEMEMEE